MRRLAVGGAACLLLVAVGGMLAVGWAGYNWPQGRWERGPGGRVR